MYTLNSLIKIVCHNVKKLCKSVPLHAWSGPEGSRKLRFPDFMTMAQNCGKVVRPYAPAAFTPQKCSWHSFLLEAESTPGPYCDRKVFISMKNPLTPAGFEPATFRFVAQHLKHCGTVEINVVRYKII